MKIDIQDSSDKEFVKVSDFPFDFKFIGSDENPEDFKIFIKQETLKSIDDYLSSDLNNELGGVLVGDVCKNSEDENCKTYIKIDNLIIAKHTNSSLSRLTFTHETWEYMNDVLEKDYPDKKILGWFHSHPGHTVFMSTFDIFIQENFFNMDYMTAYVFDPTIKERGFFYKKEGKIIRSNGYYLYDNFNNNNEETIGNITEIKEKAKIDNEIIFMNDKEDSGKSILNTGLTGFKNNLILTILFLNLLLLIYMIYNFIDLSQKTATKEAVSKEISEIKNENLKLKERLDEFILGLELEKADKKLKIKYDTNPVESNENINSTEETKTADTDQNGTEVNNSNEKTNTNHTSANSEEVIIVKYTVKPGDSLEKISILFYKNNRKFEEIMKLNNLKSKADIKIGQVLDIPEIK